MRRARRVKRAFARVIFHVMRLDFRSSGLLERVEYCTKARLVPKSMTLSLRLTAFE